MKFKATHFESMMRYIIQHIPHKFKDVLIFEPPEDFDGDKELFDFGYKEFWLCQTTKDILKPGQNIFESILNINEFYAVEVNEPPPGLYPSATHVEATWIAKLLTIPNLKNWGQEPLRAEIDKDKPLGARIQEFFKTYTEKEYINFITNKVNECKKDDLTRWH
jgi:hypothetical protein